MCHYELLSDIDNGDENSCDNHIKDAFDTLEAGLLRSLIIFELDLFEIKWSIIVLEY